jgi:hypothetical protein
MIWAALNVHVTRGLDEMGVPMTKTPPSNWLAFVQSQAVQTGATAALRKAISK